MILLLKSSNPIKLIFIVYFPGAIPLILYTPLLSVDAPYSFPD